MPDTGRTDTRRAIMDAAADVFAARGFHSATVREICAKANANIALVSRYFGSKQGLYAEVCRMLFNGLGVPLAELYRNAATDKDCRVAIREWIGWAIKITSASRRNPAGYAAVRFRAGNRLLGASGYGKISAMKLQKLSLCPVAAFAQIVGGKWKILVVRELLAAPACFGVLRRALSASAKSLSKALREMEEDCLVERSSSIDGRLPRVRYSLTPIGMTLSPLFDSVIAWGKQYRKAREKQENRNRPKNKNKERKQ